MRLQSRRLLGLQSSEGLTGAASCATERAYSHVGVSIKLPERPKNLVAGFPKASDPRKSQRITKTKATVPFVI